jgi:hypothetical protein
MGSLETSVPRWHMSRAMQRRGENRLGRRRRRWENSRKRPSDPISGSSLSLQSIYSFRVLSHSPLNSSLSMELAERYVRTWVASPRDKEIEDTVSGICIQPI